ncbi:MAG: protein-export membrane protein SecD [Candidatus Yanofskybacteria bacterium RIFCSPLOWO2_01_FULL_49_17]|uniref:Protein translocase subunit SecD n=1 Tax=Candidatus Yanofskybacteria bacterium RIFCSPLOWO2_01_FULL_49_17 TaxID=1802700 RepID=A0A1F8GQG4_9BACT|nr:MAG: protein-export membrane protein SecD [Candidatus Yanofskybacteria bacterium RIFCSPLOWO2_01_FULL_49_17]
MSSRNFFLICTIVGSLLLFIFVSPQWVNKGLKKSNIGYELSSRPFRLGLDLLGGTHLVYQADLSKVQGDKDDALQGVRDVVERRVNLFGVSEPLVQTSGQDRLIVELAGIKDVNQAIELIGQTPFLEFKTGLPASEGDKLIKQKMGAEAKDITAAALCSPANIIPLIQFISAYSADPCFKSSGLDGSGLQSAQLVFNPQTYQPEISLKLNDRGTKLFGDITSANVGQVVAIYLDGLPISVPTVQNAITTGDAVITGSFTPEEAKTLVGRLNSGALPVPISLISQQTIGASLGEESLIKSFKAGVYGLMFVALFMILFYRLPGIFSVLALGVYMLIVLAFYKFIPVTLTLAGIAGFILSLGMAVDANILIFARMKEELAAGKTLTAAMHEGFSRAWLSVRDSHVTTLIGALVLYSATTSIVKGFALTLGIGVLTSLFTATIVTRSFLYLVTGLWFEKKKWLFR